MKPQQSKYAQNAHNTGHKHNNTYNKGKNRPKTSDNEITAKPAQQGQKGVEGSFQSAQTRRNTGFGGYGSRKAVKEKILNLEAELDYLRSLLGPNPEDLLKRDWRKIHGRILDCLCARFPRSVDYETLADFVYFDSDVPNSNTLKVHVHHLRNLLAESDWAIVSEGQDGGWYERGAGARRQMRLVHVGARMRDSKDRAHMRTKDEHAHARGERG